MSSDFQLHPSKFHGLFFIELAGLPECNESSSIVGCLETVLAQQRGSFNYAKRTGGEREGDLTPAAIAGVAIACVAAVGGMVVTFFFCLYVYRQQRQADSYNSSFERTRRI